ncbi:alpha/beta hydrolase [Corynebacterium choanae]|uniref:Lysophospholipase L2 n=1 Tax=Corynebacterium choanae TaxID=1862358 RepID=A0A3G6J7H9_9CORY|nr:alpha/beta hydrolase [Corynebacterium choanae]AZA13839.1 lysophospholipase L2 [Corynebacterium choanae]
MPSVTDSIPAASRQPEQPLHWRKDHLVDDFAAATIELGADPYGEGTVCATLVAYRPDGFTETFTPRHDTALLYVHGLSDYFFHRHVAEAFDAHGIDLIGIDLRKCGRSHRHGQQLHHCRSLTDYFPELNFTLDVLRTHYQRVHIGAHSTGGIIVAEWVDVLRRATESGDTQAAQRYHAIDLIVMNSPWLDLMVPSLLREPAKRLARQLSRYVPNRLMQGKNLGTYGTSLHRSAQGEWDYDLQLKPINGVPLTWGWLQSVLNGQRRLHRGLIDTGKRTLVMCSAISRLGKPYSRDSHTADVVLDVQQIQHWAPSLSSKQVDIAVIPGGKHDLFLSLQQPRTHAIEQCLTWIDKHQATSPSPNPTTK